MRWVRIGCAIGAWTLGAPAPAAPPPDIALPPSGLTVRRLTGHPIIRPEMLPDDPVININGPSLILTPEWLPNRLGKYYLYFGNHRGPEIHLAYADRLEGPWTIHRPGPVSVVTVARINGETPDAKSHAASPDVWIDQSGHQIRMYFHFRLPKLGHVSTVAVSSDGQNFIIQRGQIGEPYLRHFSFDGWHYFVDRLGQLVRSRDGLTAFEMGPDQLESVTEDAATEAALRHTGLWLHGNRLEVLFTRVGDSPESILRSTLTLEGNWRNWKASKPQFVLSPGTPDEGIDLPIAPSDKGDAKGRQRQLRDPFVYAEGGHTYLLYSVAGESGIAIAEISGWQR